MFPLYICKEYLKAITYQCQFENSQPDLGFSSTILKENESGISGEMTGLKTQSGNVQENYEHHLDCQDQKAMYREKRRMCHGKYLN